MIAARGFAGALGAILLQSSLAFAEDCTPFAEGLLFAACPGEGTVSLLLLPEEAGALDGPPGSLTITGAYTATDTRAGGKPKPVGLFIHQGRGINLERGRMDGLLITGPEGPRIALISDLELDGQPHDLSTHAGRDAFAAAMGPRSALQSHLLIRNGAVDVRPVDDAPRFRRRLLLQRADGAIGVWDSGLRALTLYEAATEVLAAHAPVMALNLDMGSYDYCERVGEDGRVASCGVVSRDGAAKLSNLIRLER